MVVPDTVDDRAGLDALVAPALVLVGRHDFICGVRWAEELHALIPRSQLAVFEDSGHFPHLEEPGLFARAVDRFVSEGGGVGRSGRVTEAADAGFGTR
ncbi:alpha/beta hydrolase [Streptomyces sp. NPDC002133]|uniref:alpha/beta fold hydrolase n=1 Tax=Streptomyces sp. NPDC002133 TaxID=3154409 RepID=UPI003316C9E9